MMKALPFTIYQFTQYWVSGEVVTFSPTFRRVFFRLHLQKFVGITAVGADTLGASRRKIRVEPHETWGDSTRKRHFLMTLNCWEDRRKPQDFCWNFLKQTKATDHPFLNWRFLGFFHDDGNPSSGDRWCLLTGAIRRWAPQSSLLVYDPHVHPLL